VRTVAKRFPWALRSLGLAAVLLLASYRSWSQPNGGPCGPTGHETLVTDFAHYQPGQTVKATGSGYQLSCNLTVTVSGQASASTLSTTDPGGNLSFSYEVGAAPGEYTVATFMGDDADPWTSTTFTNGPYVESDRQDYAPFNPVTILGSGWVPGETITIVLRELDGPDPDVTYTAVADSAGSFTNGDFMTDNHDSGVHFQVTATGEASGYSTQARFTDGITLTSFASGNWNSQDTWFVLRSGTITTSTASTAVVGTSTSFMAELQVGDKIARATTGGPSIHFVFGIVASITDNTHLNLTANAAATNASPIAFEAHRAPLAGDDVVVAGGNTVTVTTPASINSVNMTAIAGNTLTINSGQLLTAAGGVIVTGNATQNLITVNGSLSAASLSLTGGGNGASTAVVTVPTGGAVSVSGALALSGASGSATLDLSSGSGTASAGSLNITASSPTGGRLGEVKIGTGSVTVSGNVSFSPACATNGGAPQCHLQFVGAGTANIGGDFSSGGTLIAVASSVVDFNGSGASSMGPYTTYPVVQVNKTSGAVATMNGNSTVNGLLSVVSGTFDHGATSTLTANGGVSVGSGATYKDVGTGDLTLGGGVANAGTVQMSGTTGVCGEADAVAIRSTVAGTQRSWSGAGAFDISDVDVKDQAGSASISAFSSTNSGNNGANWTLTATCVVTPKVTVNKVVVPAADSGQFNLLINGTIYATNVGNGGTTNAQNGTVGGNSFGETAGASTSLGDYTTVISGTGCTDNGNGTGTITLASGDNKTCTITNTRKPKLTVTKTVVPAADSGKFNLLINGTQYASNVGDGGSTGAQSGNIGSNVVAETAGVSTILTDYTTAFGGACDSGGSVTLAAGDNKTCTITNTRKPKLTVTKTVVPASDSGLFNLLINGTQHATNVSDGGSTGAQFGNVGSNTVSETSGASTSLTDYTTAFGGACDSGGSVSLAAGDNKTCTITNTRKPKLTVTKTLVPASDSGVFNLLINGTPYAANVSDGGSTGAQFGNIGSNTVTETGGTATALTDYTTAFGGACDSGGNVTLAAGDSKTCTITNTRKPKLTVTKTVVPASDSGLFNLLINGAQYASNVGDGGSTGAQVGNIGSNTVSETAGTSTSLTDYTTAFGGACDSGGNVTLAAGDNKTCTITNARKPRLTVNKVTNPTTDMGLFNLQIDGTTYGAEQGNGGTTGAVTVTTGPHTVSELAGSGTTLSDYAAQISGDCALDGTVTLAAGDNKVCTITNTKKPRVTVNKVTDPTTDPGLFNLQIDGTTYGNDQGNGGTTGAVPVDVVSQPDATGGFGAGLATGQSFTASVTGVVTEIDVRSRTTTTSATLYLYNGNNGSGTQGSVGSPDYSQANVSLTDAGGDSSAFGFSPIVLTTPFAVTAGQQYSFVIQGASISGVTLKDPYAGGTKLDDYAGIPATPQDVAFQVISTHTVSEAAGNGTSLSDYTAVIGGACAADGTVSLAPGDDKTCTITNTRKGSIKIVKNTSGSDDTFSFSVVGPNAYSASPSILTGGGTGNTTLSVVPGTPYSVSETVPSGWDLTASSCDSGTPGSFTLPAGRTVTCTFTNVKRGHVVVTKVTDPVNDPTSFTITAQTNNGSITAPAIRSLTTAATVDYEVTPGTYRVGELAQSGWTQTGNTCMGLTVAAGATVKCTITNTKRATLTVIKHVTNDNGGGASATSFTMSVTGPDASPASFPGSETGTTVTMNPGRYSVGETGPTGYARSDSADCSGTMAAGDVKTCTITNDDIQPKLHVIKHVANNFGGTAVASNFTMSVTGSSPSPSSFPGAESLGTLVALNAGSFSMSETGPAGYARSDSGSCSGSIGVGQELTCTVTNSDIQPTITINKILSPGSDPGRFHLRIDGTTYKANAGNGDTTGPVGVSAGTRTVDETGGTAPPTSLTDYATTIDCGSGTVVGQSTGVTIGIGQNRVCTITNSHDSDHDGIPDSVDCDPNFKDDVIVGPAGVVPITFTGIRVTTLQAAVIAASDNNVISMYANTTENVIIGNTTGSGGKDLRIVGCGHKITAANMSKPVISVEVSAGNNDGDTGQGEKDIHIEDVSVLKGSIGFSIQTSKASPNNTSTLVKSIRSDSNGIGVKIGAAGAGNSASGNEVRGANSIGTNTTDGIEVFGNSNMLNSNRVASNTQDGIDVTGDSNTIVANKVGAQGIGNQGNGIVVTGGSNTLNENDVFASKLLGIKVAGNMNQVFKNDVGESNKGNLGGGILINGNSNSLGKAANENDVFANGGNGIEINGDNNMINKNDVGDAGKGNTGDGISVMGKGNTIDQNSVFANGKLVGTTYSGDGIDVSGGTSASPNLITNNNVGDRNKGNFGNGILVAGAGNGTGSPIEISGNTVKASGLNGIKVTGTGHQLGGNVSGGTGAYPGGQDNRQCELSVVSGNFNAMGNTANGAAMAGAMNSAFPTTCQGTP
jgi:hypothetical protein